MPGWLGARLGKQRAQGTAAGHPPGSHLASTSGLSGGRGAPPLVPLDERARRAMELWPTESGDPAGLREFTREEGVFAARVQRLDVASCEHGDWRLGEIDGACAAAISRLAADEALTDIDLRQAVYLDTETTGLSGGAGVYVFMIGLGWFEGDDYVSWQGFLRHPGEERALLAEVAERLRGASALVSFFGKSFDRHRLQDKMRIAGVEPPFEGLPHLDLYHPFRRLTGDAFGNGRLQTMERELLGFHREKDLPGSLAPAAWFDFLGSRPHRLEGVFLHNHEDVLSLVVLTALLGRVEEEVRVSGDEIPGPSARRAWALAKTAPSPVEELRWVEACLARGAADQDRRAARVRRAHLLRRASRLDEARAAYREGLDELDNDHAALELFEGASMLLEHGLKDRELARTFAVRARDLGAALGVAASRGRALAARVERLDAASPPVDGTPGLSGPSGDRVARPGDQDPSR